MLALLLALAASDPSPKEEARLVLRRVGCQKCHDSALSAEHADALALFDLKNPEWSDGLSERQLRRRVSAAVGYGPKRLARVLRRCQALAVVPPSVGSISGSAARTADFFKTFARL